MCECSCFVYLLSSVQLANEGQRYCCLASQSIVVCSFDRLVNFVLLAAARSSDVSNQILVLSFGNRYICSAQHSEFAQKVLKIKQFVCYKPSQVVLLEVSQLHPHIPASVQRREWVLKAHSTDLLRSLGLCQHLCHSFGSFALLALHLLISGTLHSTSLGVCGQSSGKASFSAYADSGAVWQHQPESIPIADAALPRHNEDDTTAASLPASVWGSVWQASRWNYLFIHACMSLYLSFPSISSSTQCMCVYAWQWYRNLAIDRVCVCVRDSASGQWL